MSDTPQDPRLPEPGGGDDDTTPIEPAVELPAEPPYDPVELPPLAPLGDDLPPLDGDGEPPKRRLLSGGRIAIAAVAALILLSGAAFAVTGGSDDDKDDDGGIASVDGTGDGDGESDGSSGSGDEPTQEEFQDAMLEYAQCMREHGIDMPDPEFNEDGGGIAIGGGPGGEGAPTKEEAQAAEEACGSIMEDVRGEMTPPSPEEVAEMQDQLLAMAQCMRDRGHDMPDPEVSADGRVEISIEAGDATGAGGPKTGEEDEWMKDQEECNEEAGMEGPGGARFGPAPAGGED